MNNEAITSSKNLIANGLNSFFVNVGTNLAKPKESLTGTGLPSR